MTKKVYTQTAFIPFKKDISQERQELMSPFKQYEGEFKKQLEEKIETVEFYTKESIDRVERAFNAALAYEKNCILKYDDPFNRPGRPIPPGETMKDFASRFGTTVEEMKQQECQIDAEIERTNFKLKRKGNG